MGIYGSEYNVSEQSEALIEEGPPKLCPSCRRTLPPSKFIPVNSIMFKDGKSHICGNCVEMTLARYGYDWQQVDATCQTFNIPFVPAKWEEIHESDTVQPFTTYATFFQQQPYCQFTWSDYYKRFSELKEKHQIEAQLPEIAEEHLRQLREKWGGNYDDEALLYLEHLLEGLMRTQSVNGALQMDQALKLCKLSYIIDRKIEAGEEIKSQLDSYDKLIKEADFTPQNIKNASDFESVGEVLKYLEKTGWKNAYYDDVTRDAIDELMKNIQAFNQQLYVNESGIGDEITRRLEALQNARELENNYGIGGGDFAQNQSYSDESYNNLLKDTDEPDEFMEDLSDE